MDWQKKTSVSSANKVPLSTLMPHLHFHIDPLSQSSTEQEHKHGSVPKELHSEEEDQ